MRFLKRNPKFVQEYLTKHDQFQLSDRWTKEKQQEYIETAEFSLMDQTMMLEEIHPFVFSLIISFISSVATVLVLTKVL